MKRVGEAGREVVEHVRGVLEARDEHERLALAAPVDDLDPHATGHGDERDDMRRRVVPRSGRWRRARRILLIGARPAAATGGGRDEGDGEADYA